MFYRKNKLYLIHIFKDAQGIISSETVGIQAF
jgi:hypothetical protein